MKIIRVNNFDELKAKTDKQIINETLELTGRVCLAGGLDHVKITKNQIIVFDIGCNDNDYSYIIRRK